MSQQGVDRLSNEIDKIVDYMRREYDMNYAEMTGVFQMKIYLLHVEAFDKGNEADEQV